MRLVRWLRRYFFAMIKYHDPKPPVTYFSSKKTTKPKKLQPLQTAPPTGDLVFKCQWGAFLIQTITTGKERYLASTLLTQV